MRSEVIRLSKTLGERIKAIRLKKNITQKALSKQAGLSVNAVQGAERGECKLSTFVAIMVALDQKHRIQDLVPEALPSPIQITSSGSTRVRARQKPSEDEALDW